MIPTDNAPAALEPAPAWQDRFSVILVEPENSLNIGAVARAMMNLGFRDLRLVAPPQYDPDRAGVTARHSRTLLDTMTVHATFEEAIADCGEVVGLALQTGSAAHFVTLPQWTVGLPGRPLPRVGLVFGTEDDGLSDAQLTQCRWVIRIPSQEAFTSFNLAQSVLLVLYSLTVAFAQTPPLSAPADPAATWNEHFHLDRHLDEIMDATGFVRPGSPRPVPGTLKNLFRRLDLTAQEMGILLAFFARINRSLPRPRTDTAAGDGGPS